MEKDDPEVQEGDSLVEPNITESQDPSVSKQNKIVPVLKKTGPSKLTKLLSDEDPKPGPSNSAADFDLEVFDSGSSCSNEECWGIETKGEKKPKPETELDREVEAVTKKMEEDLSDTETELTSTLTRKHNRETQTGTDLLEPVASTSKDLPEETLDRRVSVELWKSKNETETIVEDHDVYGTDEYEDSSMDSLVLNNEDSMDSANIDSRRTSVCDPTEVLVVVDQVDQTLSRCCSRTSNPESLTDTPDGEDAHLPICDLYTQTCSAGTGRSYEVKTSQTEPEYFQPFPSGSLPSSASIPPSATSPLPSTSTAEAPRPLKKTANFQTQTEAENFRPKRKSGSFSELSLSCLPLKKQRPESSDAGRQRPDSEVARRTEEGATTTPNSFSFRSLKLSLRETRRKARLGLSGDTLGDSTPLGEPSTPSIGDNTPLGDSSGLLGDSSGLLGDSSGLLGDSSEHQDSIDANSSQRSSPICFRGLNIEESPYLSLCDNTAPTSPASPSPPSPSAEGGEEAELDLGEGSSPHKPAARSLFSPGVGRNLIPDRENPPPEILSWVAVFSRWTNAERLVAINQLINTCEPQQVRHMMQVIEPQFQRDFISLLPKELALYVLSYLDPKDLLRAAQTCRYWRVLAEDNLLWREKCREAGLQDCRENYRRRKFTSGFTYSPWKAGFMRQHNIEMNWRLNPVKQPKVLKGHDDHVITCLQFSGNRIVSGSDDNTLKVWSAVTGKCLRTLVGHTGGVWSSQMQNNVIVSGSTDRTLKVWNAETGSCVHTLYGHTSTVRCMHLHNNKVVSGSRDATLRMWDIETGECNKVLLGHVAAVRCVQYDGRLVVSGAYDYMVKVWNPMREECIHTLSGHTNRVYSLQFDGVHVVSGSLDTSIRVWDVETGACKHALMGHQSLTSGMELKDNILVSGNADSTVKIWDIITGQCLQTLSGPNKHQSAVTCLHFNKKFVVTSSDDGTVKLWDVKSGDYIRDLVSLESGGSGGVVWRIRSSPTRLVCAVGSRNGTEETKLLVLDFDAEVK